MKHIRTFIPTILFVTIISMMSPIVKAQNLAVHYDASNNLAGSTQVTDETGNGYDGSLLSGAVITTYLDSTVIDLGTSNGYVDLGQNFGTVVSSLTDFSIMVQLYIPSTSNIGGYGNFIWSFAHSNDIANDRNGCVFFSARNTRYAITTDYYVNESGIETGAQLSKGEWLTLIYVQNGSSGKIYQNGELLISGSINLSLSDLGATPFNYLGKPCYSTDDYLEDAKISDFRVYDAPLSTEQIASLSGIGTESTAAELLVKYDFESAQDSSETYTGSLHNGAQLADYGTHSVLQLGDNNGYFDFGAGFGEIIEQMDSFSISTTLLIPTSTNLVYTGCFVWTFANSTNMASDRNGNSFFSAYDGRYRISRQHWVGETGLNTNSNLPRGEWINLTYTQRNNAGKIYINGELITQGTVSIDVMELGATAYNFLGRSCYQGDAYLTAAIYDQFMIYKGELVASKILSICNNLDELNNVNDSIVLLTAMETVDIQDTVRANIVLPSSAGDEVSISWESSHPDIITDKGVVTQPAVGEDPASVTLTATFLYRGVSNQKTYPVTVLPSFTDAQSIQYDLDHLVLSGNTQNIREAIYLPINMEEGSRIVWESDSPEFLNHIGKVVKRPAKGQGKQPVMLTATLYKGDEMATKSFNVAVAEDEGYHAYLFSYFTGNDTYGEQIRFAVSNDGYTYTPLNNGAPIMSSDTISLKGGVRDPHILRCEDGETFYMVVTDMKSAEGWSSNRGMVLLKSTDLVNWTHTTVHFPTKWPDTWGNVLRVWAPQTVYDPEAGKYLVYFSLLSSDDQAPYDRIYYCYANDDFTDLETAPQILFDRGISTIDGDIVFNDAENLYHMFFKNESLGGISQVTATRITHKEGDQPGSQWSESSDPVQQTTEAVEGSGVFRLINSDDWVLMYDCYGAGHYQYCSSPDLYEFSYVRDDYSINARHGTTIPITEAEAQRLFEKWPSTSLSNTPQGARNINIRENGVEISSGDQTIDIAVHYGTDLSQFNPQLFAAPGTIITPAGEQNFENNPVNYAFSLDNNTVNYSVSVRVEANPVIPGFHADPEILYSQKTGRFYLYPTTDGYPGWGGYTFDVFSSPDLVHWTNEGTLLDLSTSQVSWATGNAWAPCIEEVKTGEDTYQYFFYFSGNAGIKKIGVAMANSPTGPFVDKGSPMINTVPSGASGQIIDGDVFTDPVSGKHYFYYGNGFLAVAELNNDMTSIKDGTTRVITPSGGDLSTYAYREAAYVFYRDGLYYFLWSVDDTGSDNYHVAYGTSDAPTGPIQVASSPIVIIQDADQFIYGTGHNSILQIPGKDEWYIVYHRINASYINNDPGIHREVCIDKLEFNGDGTIKQVTPTRKGIEPVQIDPNTSNDIAVNNFHRKEAFGKIVATQIYDVSGRKITVHELNASYQFYIITEKYENGVVLSRKYIHQPDKSFIPQEKF